MKKLKIGIFIDTFFPSIDGVVLVVDNYAKRLAKDNDVILFAPFFNNEYKDDFPYKVVRIKSMPLVSENYRLATPNIDRELKKILKKEKFDIIHIHSPFTLGRLGISIAKKQNIPVIATMHTQFKMEIKRFIKNEKFLSLVTKKVINPYNKCYESWAVNSEVAKVFKDYGYRREPKVVENGTDMLPLDNNIDTNKIINKKYKLTNDDLVFLFVGRMTKVKNLDFLIDSLKILKEKNVDFKMLFAGDGDDFKYFKGKVKKLGLNDNVLLLGKISDRNELAMLYKRAKLFLFPSVMDASSLVQVEAASQKTPTVFLKDSITAINVKDNFNGFLSDRSEEAYALKIIKILKDEKLYKKVSENCYKDLYKSWDILVKKAYDDYIEIIDNYKKVVIK